MENKMEEKVSNKETYLNRETLELLTQPMDILYYKFLQNEQILESKLLGTFDSNGKYSISKEILQEFVSAKKYIKESKDNKYILSAPTKKEENNLLFTLTIEEEDTFKVAIMRFIETNIKFDGEKEILRINVARYKDDNDIYFMGKIKKIFNIISSDEEDAGKEIDNEEFLKIVLKKFSDFNLLNKENEKIDEFTKEYIGKIIAYLKDKPSKHSEYILRHYNLFLEELKEFEGKPGYYRILRAKFDNLLDKTVEKVEDSELKIVIRDARLEYVGKTDIVQKRALEKAPITPISVKKEEQSASKPKVSPPAKKAKKGSSKKVANKKDSKGKKKDERKQIASIIKIAEPKVEELENSNVKEKVENSFKGVVFVVQRAKELTPPPANIVDKNKNSQLELTI